MTEAERALLKLYRQQVTTWLNRARMADNYSNFDLTRQALDKCWQYQRSIAELKKLSFEVERPQSPDDVASWLKEFGE